MTVRQALSATYAHLITQFGLDEADRMSGAQMGAEEPTVPDPVRDADANRAAMEALSAVARLPRVGRA